MTVQARNRQPLPAARRPGALFLTLFAAAALAAAQTGGDAPAEEIEVEPRIERRIQVVFSDGEGDTEERVWIDAGDGEGPMVFSGGDHEMIVRAPFLRPRAYLGVHLLEITPELRQHFGSTPEVGILVSAVAEDSPAAAAGIQVGDVLTTVDGEEVRRTTQVLRELAGREEGETLEVGLVRDRRSRSVAAVLAERPRSQVDLAPMFWTPGDGERRVLRLPNRILEIEQGDLDEAFSELHERLDSPEWRQKLEETTSRRLSLENRIRELEERLKEMEKRLQEDSR